MRGDGGSLGSRASLREEPSSSSNSVPTPAASVSFTYERLREFKGNILSSSSHLKKRGGATKRPNYNNTKRRLLAKPRLRVKQLEGINFNMICFSLFAFTFLLF